MFGAIAGGIASALAGGAMSKLFGGGQKAASGGIQGDVLATDNNTVGMGDAGDRKSGSAGMPRPSSYAVFCLKKKKTLHAGVEKTGSRRSGELAEAKVYESRMTNTITLSATSCRNPQLS